MTDDSDKPNIPDEAFDVPKYTQVDYWFDKDLDDQQPGVFVAEMINFLASDCRTPYQFTLYMVDSHPETLGLIEASLREDGETARELKLVSQKAERLNIAFYRNSIIPEDAFVELRRAIAPIDEWRLDKWQRTNEDNEWWVWYCLPGSVSRTTQILG